MKTVKLTKNELSIMQVLWNHNTPLSASEIKKLAGQKEWKDSSIHILINSLLKKDAIKNEGFKNTSTNFARTFRPVFSKDDYDLMNLKSSLKDITSLTIPNLVSALLDDSENEETIIEELQNILDKRKK